jgi:solute carrier family 34 (sodium-dependent phosphate cotransporter)
VTADPTYVRKDLPAPFRVALVLVLLYGFLVGVSLLEAGIAAMGSGFQTAFVASVASPLSGLFAGILMTVLVQSSSVSTATIVGLVGAGTLPVALAIPMIMGANIGTTVTNTLASLGSIRRNEEFQRGFAAATIHDFFNLMAVAILLPLELLTGFLGKTAAWLTTLLRGADFDASAPGASPIRQAVKIPVDFIRGFFEVGVPAGIVFLVLGLALIFLALTFITRNMRRLVAGGVQKAMNRLIGGGGGAFGILVGIAVTIAVQSSSITTSILVPLVASGILSLRSAYPITVGANIGTTITALLASLAVMLPEGLTIALVHTLFNLTAVALIFPIRKVRNLPVVLAERMSVVATKNHTLVAVYVLGLFIIVPLLGIFLIP